MPLVIVFDTETTGLSILTDDVLQLSALPVHIDDETGLWDPYDPLAKFDALINTQKQIDPQATAVHGISRQTLDDETAFPFSTLADALVAFRDWITAQRKYPKQTIVLAAHNAYRFDLPVLINAARRCEGSPSFVEMMQSAHVTGVLDTLPIARQRLVTPSGHRLGQLYSLFFPGKEMQNAHNALWDCMALREVLVRMPMCWSRDVLSMQEFERNREIELLVQTIHHCTALAV